MNTIEEHINSINTKLQLLLKKYAALQKVNSILNNEIETYRKNEKDYLEQINSLEIKTSILKASAGKLNDKEKHDFEKRINQYIKDLDKCMTMLNN
jgi:division protein CdvB (Snf7/Vps24/ESCRT-III family)